MRFVLYFSYLEFIVVLEYKTIPFDSLGKSSVITSSKVAFVPFIPSLQTPLTGVPLMLFSAFSSLSLFSLHDIASIFSTDLELIQSQLS